MANAFTIYWKPSGWEDLTLGDLLPGTGGSHFLPRVKKDDRIYVTNVKNGILRLLGAFTVDQITVAADGRPPGVTSVAAEYLWPKTGTSTELAVRELLPELVSRLRFIGKANQVVMEKVDESKVERNSMAKLRQLTEDSAHNLEQALISAVVATDIKSEIRRSDRLTAEQLKLATPDLFLLSVKSLLKGETHGFGESTDYDLITDEGVRLPPKAVFGYALSIALEQEILPKHFIGGEDSMCFRLLRQAGYRIVPKGGITSYEIESALDQDDTPSEEYLEGKKVLRVHVSRERKPAAARAKKAAFLKLHGRLFCEMCLADPVKTFGSVHGEACIEVHHAHIQVGQMSADHVTELQDLQCLCANCHRFVHRLMRQGLPLPGK